ncbi:MAG: lysylphosphatidylglycerol synthase transmembrane domain-containing protein [Bacteroidia bacterium]|nr:lysylphosphatidylglycerol synthase transmembrane domain-containing protein [Bacteroidia bacterium]
MIESGVGLIIGGALLLWALRGFEWEGFIEVVRREGDWLTVGGLCMIAAHALRSWRWQLMLDSTGIPHVPLVASWWALMVGYLVNLALPRMGELIRCTLLWRWQTTPFAVSIGTVVAERLIDIFTLLLLMLIVVGVEGPQWIELLGFRASHLPYFVGGLALVGVGVWVSWRLFLRKRAAGWLEAGLQGFKSLWQTRPRWLMASLSLFIWLGYWLAIWSVMRACTSGASQAEGWNAWVLLVGSGIAMALPVPGGIGTFHVIGLLLLTSQGWPASLAQVTVFTAHALQTFLILLLGSMGLIWGSWYQLRAR